MPSYDIPSPKFPPIGWIQMSLPPTNILTFYLKEAYIFLISATISTLFELCTLSQRISITSLVFRWSVSIYLTSMSRAVFFKLHLLIYLSIRVFIRYNYFFVRVFPLAWDRKFYIFSIAPATKNSITSIRGLKCPCITFELKALSYASCIISYNYLWSVFRVNRPFSLWTGDLSILLLNFNARASSFSLYI